MDPEYLLNDVAYEVEDLEMVTSVHKLIVEKSNPHVMKELARLLGVEGMTSKN